ncbi:AraC family transcriptional regulator [Agromyces laixinhei]|uniref:AraC family transcriptional regulator n=1 Tax=Agromyces laixinhei TaxID=2585717 RepID=UPI0012ED6755|nr:AraC family transcriptional regulator [Agromyces laixinhei]
MSATDAPPRPGTVAERSIDAVLESLHWSVLEFGHRELAAGTMRLDVERGIRFHYVANGEVELRRDGDEMLGMQGGDFVMVPSGDRVELHAARDTLLLSGSLALHGSDAIAPRVMPSVLFTCGFRVDEPIFAALLETMHREASSGRAGRVSVIERLADVVASAAVRIWLERGCGNALEWLAGSRDPHLGRALDAIHERPGSPWTVESLARLASSSRSQFAEQFKDAVGDTPARYVTRVRMERAERMLRAGIPVAGIAYQLGYESEAGFSRAFRRHSGFAPSLWRRSDELGSAAPPATVSVQS